VFGRGNKLKGETFTAQGVVLSTKWISENRQKAQYLLCADARAETDRGHHVLQDFRGMAVSGHGPRFVQSGSGWVRDRPAYARRVGR
jgi:hypothetical protein